MTMITVYKPSHSGDEESSEKEVKKVIPAGMPYLTKVNGKLAMARSKKDRPADNAISLLGGAFSSKTARKKSPVPKRPKSIGAAPTPLLIGGMPYLPQPGTQYPQIAFDPNNPIGMQPNLQPGPTVSGPLYAPNPTPADFEKLRGFDAHYTKYVVSDQNKATKEEKTTTTKVGVTRHMCGHCGRLRSKRYHLQHPIVPGEAPIPGFCRRCQRDASSTDSSSSTEVSRRRRKGSGRHKGRRRRKNQSVRVVEIERERRKLDSSGSEMESYVRRRRTDHKKGYARYVPGKDIATVEEETSDEDLERGRKGRRGHEIKHNRQDSQLSSIISRERSLSRVRYNRDQHGKSETPRLAAPRSPSPLFRHVKAHRRKERRARSLSPFYRHVEAPRDHEKKERRKVSIEFFKEGAELEGGEKERRLLEEDLRESNRGRKISIEDLEGQELAITPPNAKNIPIHFSDDDERLLTPDHPPPRRRVPRHDFEPPGMPSRESSFGSLDTSSSIRSHEACERRRRERNSPVFPQPPWGPVHESPTKQRELYPASRERSQSHFYDIHPEKNGQIMVATEKQAYQSKRELEEERRRDKELEEERRRQEYIDKATLERRNKDMQAKRFSMMNEAAKYYQDDWRNDKYSDDEPEPPVRRRIPRKSYRTDRDGFREESLVYEEVNYRTEAYDLPRAPSPPAPIKRFSRSQTQEKRPSDETAKELWQKIIDAPPYPITPEGLPSTRYDYPYEREYREEMRRPSPMVSDEDYDEQRPSRSRGTSRVRTPEEFEQLPIRNRSTSEVRIILPPEGYRSRSNSRVSSQYLDSFEPRRTMSQAFALVRPDERQENRSRSTSRAPSQHPMSRESSRPPTHTRESAHFSEDWNQDPPKIHITDRDRDRSTTRYYGEVSEAPTRMRSDSEMKKHVKFHPDTEYRERTVSEQASEVSALEDDDGGGGDWEKVSAVSAISDAGYAGGWGTSGIGPTGAWS